MRPGLGDALTQLRRAGVRDGSAALARGSAQLARGVVRDAVLRRRPLRAAPGELAAALAGTDPVRALRGPVLAALPTVAAFESSLRSGFVERADAVAAHRFDLLGSGATDLGPEIDWHVDFKTGRRWPLRHSSLLPVSYGDGSDIKVPWELSRGQHLPLLAGAHRVTGDRRYLDELGAELTSWIRANPVERGPNWACTMDVAIRAANWIAALAIAAEHVRDEPWFTEALESLLLHGRFIRTHLEDGEVRGNHYLSDVVGLLAVAALFSTGWEGRAWADWAAGELVAEMEHQVRGDGCAHEASIPYHRLVTELFLCGLQAADALTPGRIPDWCHDRLDSMLAFVADYTRPDGLAPQVGDADDGRFLPLGEYGRDPRDHRHLFAQTDRRYEPSLGHSAYPEGGFYTMRVGDLYVLVRCGDTGRYGRGGHSHNDQLSFELALGERPLIVDPGAYVYTADPAARNLFRSTAFHSTLRVDGVEQNELRTDDLFAMEDRTQAQTISWEPRATGAVFEGHHFGYLALPTPARHTRRIELDGQAGELLVRDTVTSQGPHELEWTFPLAPGAESLLEVHADGLEFALEDGWYSPRYGVRVPTKFLRARRRSRPGDDVTEIVLRPRVRAAPATSSG
ncbi:MAG TPA: alginate lyase family protein [Gaiellaceae bacterium]|nr:alginate lyase family protein [Gaiellaceae bacterium]